MNKPVSSLGIILAGGLARRMGGGDKCLLPLAGKTLLQRVIERAQPQVSTLLLNANGSSLRFARTRLTVIADIFPQTPGALAGIHTGLTWMRDHTPEIEWLVSFASDTPFFPQNLVTELHNAVAAKNTQLAIATSQGGVHPTFALWHTSLLEKIDQLLKTGQTPRLQEWVDKQDAAYVDFSADNYDPFFNINTPQDLYTAEPLAALVK